MRAVSSSQTPAPSGSPAGRQPVPAQVPASPAALTPADWLRGARPGTLVMSVASVGSGAASALWFARSCELDPGCRTSGPQPESAHWWLLTLLALLVALLLQIAANYVDDAADGLAGRDSTRSQAAPRRLVARGADPRRVLRIGIVCTAVACVLGVLACALAGGDRWWLVLLGAVCVLAAWGYSAGPRPLSTGGWAPLVVVAVFGLAGVAGTQFLLTGAVSMGALMQALAQGCACAAVLLVNDIRDAADDAEHGKRTLAVRLGGGAGLLFRLLAFVGPLVLAVQAVSMRSWPALALAVLAGVPAVWDPVRHARQAGTRRAWSLALGMMCAVPPVLMLGLWSIAARV
jgi:1,4-dihydroxy-2-naphthoate octaprenyltransferase